MGAWTTVATSIAAAALSDVNMGLMAPFFPEECARRGVPHTLVGVMFSVLPVGSVLGTVGALPVIDRVGCRRVLFAALFLQGLLALAFASLRLVAGRTAFIGAVLAVRSVQGLCGGVFETALLSILMKSVPEHLVGAVVGYSEAGRACGFLLGPVIGGALFDAGGFDLPFLVVGGALLTLPVPLRLVMRAETEDSSRHDAPAPAAEGANAGERAGEGEGAPAAARVCALLRLPPVCAGLAVQLAMFVAIAFLDPTLQPFLATPPLALSPASVGLLLGLAVLCYILVSLVSAALAARIGDLRCLVAGFVLAAAALVLLGPSPLLPAVPAHSLPLTLGLMAALGSGAGLTVAPCTNLMVAAASRGGQPMQVASDQLATLSNLAYSLGAATGPLLGGGTVQLLGGAYSGFRWATTGLGIGLACLMALLTPIFLCERGRGAAHKAKGAALRTSRAQTGISDPMLVDGVEN